MSGILRLESLTKGNTLKQGDKTPLKYRLFDADGEKLNIAGKSAKVRLVYPDFLTIGYERDGLTVAQDDTVTFTIDQAIPARIYHVEIIVDSKFVFPSRADEAKFTVDKSSLGADANIIEIVGKDVLIQAVKSQVDTELQPLVTSLESAQQAETQRASEESSRASAEAQRVADHANRSAELAGKADKVVLKNELISGDFTPNMHNWTSPIADVVRSADFVDVTPTRRYGGIFQQRLTNEYRDKVLYVYGMVNAKSDKVNLLSNSDPGSDSVFHSGTGNWEMLSFVHKQDTDATRLRIEVRDDHVSPSEKFQVKYVAVIDLTTIFGTGNEPTKEEMDELINITGYIDGEYALNNKEMLGHLMNGIREKANKKQEDWITATLKNGATGDVKYRKNEFGRVEFTGHINIPAEHSSSYVMSIAPPYTPKTDLYLPAGLDAFGVGSVLYFRRFTNGDSVWANNVWAGRTAYLDGMSYVN